MSDTRTPTAPEPRNDQDAVIAHHREQLKQLFPLPDAAQLQRKPRSPIRTVAPVLALGLLGGLLWWNPAWRHESHASAPGERRTVALSDGSKITLDAGSHIDVSHRLLSRQVALERGRARFEVTHSRLRSFHVAADGTDVHVVGTVFDVRRDGNVVDVAVVSGVVAVSPAQSARRHLTAGQWLQIHAGRAQSPQTVALSTLDGWLNGRIEFARTPLADALAELQRHHPASIVLEAPALANLPLSGVFNTHNTEAALDLLPQILPVRVVRAPDGSIHVLALRAGDPPP